MFTQTLKWSRSIAGQLFLVATLASILLIASILWDNHKTLNTALTENVRTSILQTSRLLNMTVTTQSTRKELSTVKIFFDEMIDPHAKNGLVYVAIGDAHGNPILSTTGVPLPLPAQTPKSSLDSAVAEGIIHVRNPLLLASNEVGFLQYGLSTENIVEATSHQHRNSLLRTLLVIAATFSIIIFIGKNITRRFSIMVNTSQDIVKGQLGKRIDVGGIDELSQMSQQFNCVVDALEQKIAEVLDLNQSLENRVKLRTFELEQSKQDLENNLIELRETQRRLINSEKMAGLGSLVAGIAHELNTPIGNAYTVSTTVTEKVKDFEAVLSNGSMKRSTLKHFCTDMSEAASLLNKNLQRASELIISFKTVAVDQSSEHHRAFNLLKTIEELSLTLRVQLRKKKINLILDIPDNIEMESYPGPLTQVITNLFNNALIHGFEGRDVGEIKISAKFFPANPNLIELQFGDDGRGIEPRIIDKIFDPFFTTKFGQGGSGLGLNICYNIVYSLLEGEISVHSVVGIGTKFTLVLPARTFKNTET